MVTTKLFPPYTNKVINQSNIVSAVTHTVDLGTLPIQVSAQVKVTNSASDTGAFIDGVLASGTVTITDYTLARLTKADGTITFGSPDNIASASGTVTVADYTKAGILNATATIQVDAFANMIVATATPSGTITYGAPSDGSTVIFTGLPTDGTKTFTKVTGSPGADEFSSIVELTGLIQSLTDLNASDNGTTITITVFTAGTSMNTPTVTGTATYSALSLTFSGGQNNGVLTVGAQSITQGTEFTAETNDDTTATNIANALDTAFGEEVASATTDTVTFTNNPTPGTAGDGLGVSYVGTAGSVTISGSTTGGRDATIVTVAGTALVADTDWTAETSDNVTADNLASAIDGIGTVDAPNPAAAIITVTASTGGTGGNSLATVTDNTDAVTVGGALLTGGVDASTVTVDGTQFTKVAAAPGAAEFTNISELTALVEALGNVDASDDASITTVVAATAGTAGNSIAMAQTGTGLSLSGSLLTGGIDGAVVTVDGNALTESVDWNSVTNDDTAADNLQLAIDALGTVQAANPGAAIITVKAATVGTAGNSLTTVLTSGAGVTVQQATLAGGLLNAVDASDDEITLDGHGYSTAVKVNYDVIAGTTVDNLVNNTDYWVIKVDENRIKLATTEANANAGTQIDIAAADDTVGGGSFTLTPTALDVDVTIGASNDNLSFVTVASETLTATGSTLVAISNVTFRYLKITVEPNDSEADVVATIHSKM